MKLKISIVLITSILITLLCFHFYPRKYLTVGVYDDQDDAKASFIKNLGRELGKNGIELKFKKMEEFTGTDPISFLHDDSQVDFIMHGNFRHIDTKEISSLGVVSRSPILFFKNPKSLRAKRIRNIDDLHLSKIIVFNYPIKNTYVSQAPFYDNPIEIVGNPYTTLSMLDRMPPLELNDQIEPLGTRRGHIGYENTVKLQWPNLKKAEFVHEAINLIESGLNDADWDILVMLDPIADVFLRPLIINNVLEFFQFDDISSFAQRNKFYSLYNYPQSTYSYLVARDWKGSKKIPPRDIKLLTYTNSISVKSNLDSSLIELLTDAVEKSAKLQFYRDRHIGIGFLANDINEFPKFSSEDSFYQNPIAKRYYRDGPGLLSEILTPTTASFLKTIALILIPLLTFIYPVAKITPKLYSNYIKNQIYLWYKKLEILESSFKNGSITKENFLSELSTLENELSKFKIPFLYSYFVQDLYIAREHLELISNKINSK
jgi:hypothetical protein